MPAALAHAGFEVTLLAPAGALVHRSRFVARAGTLPDGADVHAWIFSFVAAVRAARPTIVIPGDEMTLQLLQLIAATPPPELRPDVALELADLITRSLGPRQFYQVGADKGALQPFLERVGIPVPPYAVVQSAAEAEQAAHALGPQTVVKPVKGSGGHGVSFCDTPRAAGEAFRRALEPRPGQPGRAVRPPVLVQRRVIGMMIPRTSVAYQGVELGGFARERLQAVGPKRGASVVRYKSDPQLAALSRTLARALEITGFFAMEYCVEQASGKAYAIDFSRRLAPSHHTGRLVGVDLCAALAAALRGEVSEPRELPEGFDRIMACFPQEYWRDPLSPALNQYPTDAPWDDPGLLQALLDWQYDPEA